MAATFMQFKRWRTSQMGQTVDQYERDGYCIAAEQIAPDDVLEKALQGMVAVRDGKFDMGMPPTEHPGYDPAVLCKINNPHRSDTGLHGLVTCPQVGRKVAEITGAQRVQVWASQLLIKPPGSASRRARRLASRPAVLAHVAAGRRAFYSVDRAVRCGRGVGTDALCARIAPLGLFRPRQFLRQGPAQAAR